VSARDPGCSAQTLHRRSSIFKPGTAPWTSCISATPQGERKELAFSFNRASLTGLPFGVGKGGPETFSPDMMGLRARLITNRCNRMLIFLTRSGKKSSGCRKYGPQVFPGSLLKLRSQSLAPKAAPRHAAATRYATPKKFSTCSQTI
jgi:hypothetical protein